LEVGTELLDPLEGQRRVGVGIELADGFFGFPHGGHVAAGVTGTQQTHELVFARLAQSFFGLGEKAPAPIERIVLAASVSHGLVLHPPTALVELGVGEVPTLLMMR
jgi:hypothetical protein